MLTELRSHTCSPSCDHIHASAGRPTSGGIIHLRSRRHLPCRTPLNIYCWPVATASVPRATAVSSNIISASHNRILGARKINRTAPAPVAQRLMHTSLLCLQCSILVPPVDAPVTPKVPVVPPVSTVLPIPPHVIGTDCPQRSQSAKIYTGAHPHSLP